MSDQRDRALEKLYAQQEKHSEKVKASVNDMKRSLGDKDRGGAMSATNIKRLVIALVVIVFVGMTAVMMAEPASRGAWGFTLFCAVGAGVFLYSKKHAGG